MDSAKRKKNIIRQEEGKYSRNYGIHFPEEDDVFFSAENYSPSAEGKNETLIREPVISERFEKKNRKKIWFGCLVVFFSLAFLFFLGSGIYFILKISSVSQKIIVENDKEEPSSLMKNVGSIISSANSKILAGEEEGRINILLLGIAGENNPGKNLTDTIMVLSVNTDSKKVALLSLPRDLYTKIPDTNIWTKINSIYQYGINNDLGSEPIKKSAENITGLKIHYFLIMDFEGFKKIIDDIGGINVFVEKGIYDPRYPGPNYSYETFEIKKGMHKMDGETALKYARERHSDSEGDFGRAKRQQKVIQSFKNKAFSIKTFLNVFTFNKLLNALEENIKTDISLDEIESFINLSRKVDSQNITNAVVDAWKKDSLLKVSHIYSGDIRVFILIPRAGNYTEIHDLAQNIFDLEIIERRKLEIENEKATIAIINQSSDYNLTYKIKNLLEKDLGFNKVTILRNKNNETSEQSVVFNLTLGEKPFSLDEIIKKLPAQLGNNDSSDIIDLEKNYDFVISLGEDLEKIYKFEEDSIEDLNNAEYDQMHLDLLSE